MPNVPRAQCLRIGSGLLSSRFQYWLNYFKTHINTQRQRLIVVFDAIYGPPEIEARITEDQLGQIAIRYANIVRSEPLIVGMVGFTWQGFDDYLGIRDVIQGVRDDNRLAINILLGP